MHLVLCYDVVEDKRRRKLFDGLRAFLQPVQKSVFEGFLPQWRHRDLRDMVTRTIDRETDTVRIYQLCKGCRRLTKLEGTAREVYPPDEDVII